MRASGIARLDASLALQWFAMLSLLPFRVVWRVSRAQSKMQGGDALACLRNLALCAAARFLDFFHFRLPLSLTEEEKFTDRLEKRNFLWEILFA